MIGDMAASRLHPGARTVHEHVND